jgi:hypothetical protein
MNMDHADTRHPVDYMEPLDEDIRTDRAVVLARLLDTVFPRDVASGEKFEAAFRRFVAICMIIRPELFGGASQITIARFVGCTSANLSKLLTGLADDLGIRCPSMETDHAREAKSKAQRHRCAPTQHGLTADAKHQHSVDLAINLAKKKLASGKAWSKFEKLALFERGLIDDEHRATAKGKAFFETPPGRGPLPPQIEGGLPPSR